MKLLRLRPNGPTWAQGVRPLRSPDRGRRSVDPKDTQRRSGTRCSLIAWGVLLMEKNHAEDCEECFSCRCGPRFAVGPNGDLAGCQLLFGPRGLLCDGASLPPWLAPSSYVLSGHGCPKLWLHGVPAGSHGCSAGGGAVPDLLHRAGRPLPLPLCPDLHAVKATRVLAVHPVCRRGVALVTSVGRIHDSSTLGSVGAPGEESPGANGERGSATTAIILACRTDILEPVLPDRYNGALFTIRPIDPGGRQADCVHLLV